MRASEAAVDLESGHANAEGQRGAPALVVNAAPKPRREPSERLANLERLRIVAMLEIVTFHVGGAISGADYRLPLVGGLGLPIFLLLNNAFNTTLSERMGTRAFLDVKVSRLMMPWLIWSCVYAALVLGEKTRHHESLSEAFSPWMIVGGTYTHLWFVPFALFGSLLIAGLQTRTKGVSHRLMAGVALAAGGAIVLLDAWLLHTRVIDWPVLQWLFALPSPLLGFALGRVMMSRDRPLLRKLCLLLGVLALLAIGLSVPGWLPEMGRRYAVSMALVGAFFLWPGKLDAWSRHLTPLLFGVYLTHPLLVRVYQSFHLPGMPVALMGIVIFAVSTLVVEAMRRTPLRRLV